jgi:hypothetical protein
MNGSGHVMNGAGRTMDGGGHSMGHASRSMDGGLFQANGTKHAAGRPAAQAAVTAQ